MDSTNAYLNSILFQNIPPMPIPPLLECVPNFSEGRDPVVIQQITNAIQSVEGISLLDVDPGKATNRTVVTFVGAPEAVVEAAFRGIAKAAELIDMRQHQGEHPRMGATDVCPLIPLAGMTMEQAVQWAHTLAERVGRELGIPVYLYEYAASRPERRNLADIRAGEYEALPAKLQQAAWQPDYGTPDFNARSGATVIGARDFLIAYNVNLNTTSVRRANAVAFDVREKGRRRDQVTKRPSDQEWVPGALKFVKGIGWYIEEYGIAQVSLNLTNIRETPMHRAFEECCKSAERRGMRVTGSELVGMVPLQAMLEAGKYFLQKQQRSVGVSEEELIKIAVKSLGLDDLTLFDPQQKIIEYRMRDAAEGRLVQLNLRAFANETAAENVAPGGGSVAAYVGALGVSLATMVANLSSHKRGWDNRWEFFSDWAEKGQHIKDALLKLVDEDTNAYNALAEAYRLPKGTEAEQQIRQVTIQEATRQAMEVPFQTLKWVVESLSVIRAMAEHGNPNSATDAGVGALCARAAAHGAFLNVKVNLAGLEDQNHGRQLLQAAETYLQQVDVAEREILEVVNLKIK